MVSAGSNQLKIMVLLVCALIVLVVLPAHRVSAVDVIVSNCTEAGLDTALSQVVPAGGMITFSCSGTIAITSQKVFDGNGRDYVIDGGGEVTLDGQNQTRIFLVPPGRNVSLSVRGLTLTGGMATAAADNGVIPNGGQGGAIFFHYGNRSLEILDSTFTDNSAAGAAIYDGGGVLHIRNADWLHVENSTFTGNTAKNGGVMNILITSGYLANNEYINNTATNTTAGGGGAIYIDNGMLTFANSLFQGNTTAAAGGGYFNAGGSRNIGDETLINLTFDGNHAGMQGGGVYTVDDRFFVSGSTFYNNTATGNGGGLVHESKNNTYFTAQISNSTFSGNRSGTALLPDPDPDATNGNGGGIVNSGAATMSVTNTTLYDNHTGVQGSAMRNGNGTLIVRNSIIANNTSTFQWVNEQCHNVVDGGGNIQYPANDPTWGREARCFTNRPADADAMLQAYDGVNSLHPILASSSAVDAGSCFTTLDQRGMPRPQGQACDAGAYEVRTGTPVSMPTLTGSITTAPVKPGFTWSDTSINNWYNIFISQGANVVINAWVASSTVCSGSNCTVNADDIAYVDWGLLSGNYSWRIQSWNASDGVVATDAQTFNVSLAVPDAIVTTTPTDGGTVADDSVAFSWQSDTNALWYNIVITATNGYSIDEWHEASVVCSGSTCTLPARTLMNGTYEWYMLAWGPGGTGPWSSGTTFFVGTAPPAMITRLSPEGTVTEPSVTLSWEADDNAQWYQVYVISDGGQIFTNWFAATDTIGSPYGAVGVCEAGTCTLPASISNFWLSNGDYSWWVAGWGAGGMGQWDITSMDFVMSAGAVASVVQMTPADGATVLPGSVTLTWEEDTNAAWYNIFVGGDNGYTHFEWYEAGEVCEMATCSITLDLDADTYIWYMNAWGSAGMGDWNNGSDFTVSQ